ncbi:hypothetical protein [Massilia niabensis]|uniref:Uncharacterized protein n=1 Tax=Massilia niabensis TaxID=544910 RepID=A0ABW0L7A4_9BURK
MARGPSLARQAVKKAALRVVAFIVARPRLDDFLRRQIYRFPGLAGRVRAAVAHSRRADWQTLPVLLSDEAELTDSARQVLQDLRRAIDHTRTP